MSSSTFINISTYFPTFHKCPNTTKCVVIKILKVCRLPPLRNHSTSHTHLSIIRYSLLSSFRTISNSSKIIVTNNTSKGNLVQLAYVEYYSTHCYFLRQVMCLTSCSNKNKTFCLAFLPCFRLKRRILIVEKSIVSWMLIPSKLFGVCSPPSSIPSYLDCFNVYPVLPY